MSILGPSRKHGDISGPQRRLAVVLDKNEFSFQNNHKLIGKVMPMPVRR